MARKSFLTDIIRPLPAARRRLEHRRQKKGDEIGYRGHKHQGGEKDYIVNRKSDLEVKPLGNRRSAPCTVSNMESQRLMTSIAL